MEGSWLLIGSYGEKGIVRYKDSENHRLSEWLPAVIEWPIERTSDPEGIYNCFAYVAGDTNRKWDALPVLPPGIYWPTPVKDEEEGTIWPYLRGYESLGFEWCEDGSFQEGVEKIAIFVDDNDVPMHVAIQRENGIWQSKLGPDIDVSHSLESLTSSEKYEWRGGYGTPKYFMSRKGPKCPLQK